MNLLYGGIVAGTHAAALLIVLADRELPTSRRRLALALIATLPFVGVALAALICRVRGNGDSPALRRPRLPRSRRDRAAIARDQAPLVERLLGSPAERRAALATLARCCDETSVAAMRWLIERGHSDAVVEAALALEDLHERRMQEIDHARTDARADADAAPSWRRSLAGAELVANTIHSGLADPSMITTLSALARQLYQAAADAAARPEPEVLAGWARLELAAMQPHRAVDLLASVEPPHDPVLARRIHQLRSDALFAARRALQERRATASG